MNARKVTVQAPPIFPKPPPGKGHAFVHVVCSESGFRFRWVPLNDSPIYIRPKTGEKCRLTMSLTSEISKLPKHGKVVLTFHELLVSNDGKKIYRTWKPTEWFPYVND